MEKKRSGQGGFTLVELLVVIAILGILAAIVVFAVAGVGDKGQAAADKTTCSVLQTAEEAYFASPVSGGTYTASQDTLKAQGFLHTTNTGYTIAVVAGPPASYTITAPAGAPACT
jgi:general secretion pathway protein G